MLFQGEQGKFKLMFCVGFHDILRYSMFQAKEAYQRALSVLPHAALPDDKKQNLEQHFREQIGLREKEMATPPGE